jgi:hypothetical protein
VIGQILQLNANSDSECTSPDYRGARVVAITNSTIVVADTLNPTGGYTDAEYASLGVTFDTLIDPLDRAAFGDPSDIDGNKRIVLFFTKGGQRSHTDDEYVIRRRILPWPRSLSDEVHRRLRSLRVEQRRRDVLRHGSRSESAVVHSPRRMSRAKCWERSPTSISI